MVFEETSRNADQGRDLDAKTWVLKVMSVAEISLSDLLFRPGEIRDAVQEIFEGLGLDIVDRDRQIIWFTSKMNAMLLDKVERKVMGAK